MKSTHRIDAAPGTPLRDRLFEIGVEFPCGGALLCGKCRMRVVSGEVPVTAEMREVLSNAEILAGWRLACFAAAVGPVEFEVEQWSAPVLAGDERIEPEPRPGFGIAVDVGTTTLAAQLLDLETGEVLETATALNPQAQYGADVMARIAFELDNAGILATLVRQTVGGMVSRLAAGRTVEEVVLCGNSVMHHLFSKLSVAALGRAPFRTAHLQAAHFDAAALGWHASVRDGVTFLPNIGGFVGSDVLCGLMACGVGASESSVAFADLGTNGEVAIGSSRGILCASTAAGPAFEAGRIHNGMRAGLGAIDRVEWRSQLHCEVIGGGPARGLCGSGLVDAVSVLLDTGAIAPNGRFRAGTKELALTGSVKLTQADVRELQLAKGAVAAGLLLLQERSQGLPPTRLHLAGAFGNYVRPQSARGIGLLPTGCVIQPEGNTALRGARLLLLHHRSRQSLLDGTLRKAHHVELGGEAEFQDAFAACMRLAPLAWDHAHAL